MAEISGDMGDELKRLRLLRGLTQEELGAKIGRGKAYISNLERGESKFRSASEVAQSISAALGVGISHWASFTSDGHLSDAPELRRRPMLGWVGAGPGVEGEAEKEYVEVPSHLSRCDVVYRVRGTSMVGAGIEDGDYIAVRENPEPQDKEVVVAWIEPTGMVIKMIRWPVIGARARFLVSKNGTDFQHQVRAGDRVYGTYVGAFQIDPPKRKSKRAT